MSDRFTFGPDRYAHIDEEYREALGLARHLLAICLPKPLRPRLRILQRLLRRLRSGVDLLEGDSDFVSYLWPSTGADRVDRVFRTGEPVKESDRFVWVSTVEIHQVDPMRAMPCG